MRLVQSESCKILPGMGKNVLIEQHHIRKQQIFAGIDLFLMKNHFHSSVKLA